MRVQSLISILLLLVIVGYGVSVYAVLAPGECEVCIGVVDKIRKSLPKTATTKDDINKHIRSYCKTAKEKENRFCYYIGGTADAATGLLNSVSVPIINSLPSERICEQMKKVDLQICELRYTSNVKQPPPSDSKPEPTKTETKSESEKPKKTTTSGSSGEEDLNKLKVRELKDMLNKLGGECKGCTEKSEFVKKIQQMRKNEDGL